MKMFTFIRDGKVLKDVVRGTTLSHKITQPLHVLCIKLLCPQIYVHCDAVICDTTSKADGICRGQCVHPTDMTSYRHPGIKGKCLTIKGYNNCMQADNRLTFLHSATQYKPCPPKADIIWTDPFNCLNKVS